jgi:hypothetical protein
MFILHPRLNGGYAVSTSVRIGSKSSIVSEANDSFEQAFKVADANSEFHKGILHVVRLARACADSGQPNTAEIGHPLSNR